MWMLIPLWVTVGLLGSCRTEDIKCTTQTPKGTRDRFPGYYCDCSRIKNGTVTASIVRKQKSVVTWSNCTLQTNKCVKKINFKCHCPWGIALIANCTINRTGNAGLKDKGIPASHWIVPLVFILPLLLLVILWLLVVGVYSVIFVIAYKCREDSLRGRVNQPNHQEEANTMCQYLVFILFFCVVTPLIFVLLCFLLK